MRVVRLGSSPVKVSRVIFGAMARGDKGQMSRVPLVQTALASGITTIDTAPLYEFGDSERWVGRGLEGQRDKVVVCTKVGLRWDSEHGDVLFSFTDEDGQPRSVRMDSRPHSIRTEIDNSLKRIGTNVLDLVQVHFPDRHTPIAATMQALSACVRAGSVRAIGISNFDLPQTQEAHRALSNIPLACLQIGYSLVDRRAEDHLLPWAEAHGVGVLAYSPLAEGLLAGKYLDADPTEARHGLTEPRTLTSIRRAILSTLQPIADDRSVSMAQVALAWLLAQPAVTAVIAGASRPEQISANAAAASLQLTDDECAKLRRGFSAVRVDQPRGLRRLARATRSKAAALWRRLR